MLWIVLSLEQRNFRKVFIMADRVKPNEMLIQESSDGHTETVKLLLDAGADVHVAKDQALRWASGNGHTEVVKALLDAGANVRARDKR
jgi:ankyrin repeat protein